MERSLKGKIVAHYREEIKNSKKLYSEYKKGLLAEVRKFTMSDSYIDSDYERAMRFIIDMENEAKKADFLLYRLEDIKGMY